VWLIASLNFFIVQVLPGDPTRVLLPRGSSNVTQGGSDLRAQLIRQWGLDQPITTRYVVYFENLAQGNLGTTITYQKGGFPVAGVIAPRLSTTLVLVGLSTAATMWLGIVLGRFSGWRRGRRADVSITITTLVGYSMPSFWVSLVLIFALAYVIPVFPAYGVQSRDAATFNPTMRVLDQLYHYFLPVLTFVITNVAWFSLTLRNSLTDTLPEDYMLTAMAKGLTEKQQLRKHAMPNARLPLLTASALYFGWVVSGAIVIEEVFNIPGLGQLTWDATSKRDYPLLSGVFLVATLGVVVANAIADILYMYLDPRVREA
jgi:peptide/nickel transport system permease protein